MAAARAGMLRPLGNRIRSGRTANRPRWADQAAPLLGAAVLFHTLDLLVGAFNAGNIPVTNFAQSLSFLAWLTAIVSFILISRMRMQVLGAFVAPGVLATVATAMLLTRGGRLVIPDSLRSAWLPVHVTLAFLGDALFVVAAGVSLAYLVYESRLKAKRPMTASGQSMPSLEKLDRINYRLLGWGFVMLSLGIVSGALWAEATWGHFWSWEPQESWSLITWLLYAGLLEFASRRRMARAAGGSADARGVYCVAGIVPQREPAFSGQARREFRLTRAWARPNA